MSYLTNIIKSFGYLGILVGMSPMDAKTTGPIRMKLLPLIPYDPGMVLRQKKLKKFKRGPEVPFLLKNAFFSNSSIIYDPIELKL